jgi:hypothetical protein
LEIPAGADLLQLRLEPGDPERLGRVISGVSGMALLLVLARLRLLRRRTF